MGEPVSVLLADDHTLFRQGLRRVLELEPEFRVVAEASDAEEALQKAQQHRPQVVVLDISMPGGGLEAAGRLRQLLPGVGVVMLTMHADEEYLLRAMSVGAHGYLVKDVDSHILLEAIRAASQGRPYLHSGLAGRALSAVARGNAPEPPAGPQLTERELEVLRLVGQGASNREIAETLYISIKTTKNHLTHIFEKLGVSDRTQAALWAVRAGIVNITEARAGKEAERRRD